MTWGLQNYTLTDILQDMGFIRSGPLGHPQPPDLKMTNLQIRYMYLKNRWDPDLFFVSWRIKYGM